MSIFKLGFKQWLVELILKIRRRKMMTSAEIMANPDRFRSELFLSIDRVRRILMGIKEVPRGDLVVFNPIHPLLNYGMARVHNPTSGRVNRIVIYVPGGSFVRGSSDTHGHVSKQIAEDHNAMVYTLDYMKAPENVFPVAVKQLLGLMEHVRKTYPTHSLPVYWAGDSAGASIILQAMYRLLNNHDGYKFTWGLSVADLTPQGLLLCCPFLDFAFRGESLVYNDGRDVALSRSQLEGVVESYLGDKSILDPEVNMAEVKWRNYTLPPTVVVSGTRDVLYSDAEYLVSELTISGQAHSHIEMDAFHGFTIFHPWMPRSRTAIDHGMNFLTNCRQDDLIHLLKTATAE